MLNEIRKSTIFKNDLKKYNTAIESLPDGSDKEEMQRLLSNLIQEVKKMDDLHLEMIFNKQMSSLGSERRDGIMSIRKKLESKLKELKSN